MSKSIKLDFEPNFDFILIGFVSSEPLYKMSWLINEMLEIQLKECSSIKEYNTKRQLVQEYPMFQFKTENESTFQLFHNKSTQGYLIEEQKQVDYWLKIENSEIIMQELLKKLKGLKNVNLAFEVKPGSLKSKLRLLFTFEEN